MSAKSVPLALKEALLAMLNADKAWLTVDSRPATVLDYLAVSDFSQRLMPLVVVGRPYQVASQRWTREEDLVEYLAPIMVIDAAGVRPGDDEAAEERVDVLWEQVRAVLGQEKNAHLRLGNFRAFYSSCGWSPNDSEAGGNNLVSKAQDLRVPLVVGRSRLAAT